MITDVNKCRFAAIRNPPKQHQNRDELEILREIEISAVHVEMFLPERKVKYSGHTITFVDKKPPRFNTRSDALGPHSQDIGRNLHPNLISYDIVHTYSRCCHAQNTVWRRNIRHEQNAPHNPAANAPNHHSDKKK